MIVDIGPTKRFPVDPFAAYVALSRSRGRESIHLLRDFDDRIFTRHPSDELSDEDERLERLATETKNKYDMGYCICIRIRSHKVYLYMCVLCTRV